MKPPQPPPSPISSLVLQLQKRVCVCVCDGSVGISFIRIKLHLCSFILWFFVFILINYLFLVMYFVCFVNPQLAEYEFVVCIHCYGKPPVNVI